jgi:hypothetical protein
MSFKTWAASQDNKQRESDAKPAKAKPESAPAAPTPQPAPDATTPSNEDRKLG